MFESARLKIKRAEQHISDLEARFAAHVATNPHKLLVENNPETGNRHIRVLFKSDPTQSLALIAGDAIHNIRVALDHMTWEAVGRDGGTTDRYLYLPSGDDRVNYESRCKRIKTPSNWVKDLFISLEIFPRGTGDGLYALTQLDNTDKHSTLAIVVKATTTPEIRILSPSGTPALTLIGNTFISTSTDYFDIGKVPHTHKIEFDEDADCAPTIVFNDVRWPNQPVIPTIKQFSQLALGAIQAFEAGFGSP